LTAIDRDGNRFIAHVTAGIARSLVYWQIPVPPDKKFDFIEPLPNQF
jgi:hypothetical protein